MTKKYRSDAFAAIHETMEALHEAGVVNTQTMREFDAACLTPILALKQAAKTLTELESGQPSLAAETTQWVEAPLTSDDDADFNAEEFERKFSKAQPL